MSGAGWKPWLSATAADRDALGLRRTLRVRVAGEDVVDLAGNDYLGLSTHPRVVDAAVAAARQWGAGATASRLVTGTTRLHEQLEHDLAAFTDAEAALVFSSGYAANLGVVTALGGPDVLVVSDEGNHASIIDACRLARARVVVAPHADLAAMSVALRTRDEPRAMLVTDAAFSVAGDLAPLAELHELTRAQGALLVVDEAHTLGVVGPGGRGLAAAAGIAAEPDVVRTVTLSKALGSQGGAVVGTRAVVEHLLNAARTFIFDTGLAPAAAGAARAALLVLAAEPERADRVRERARTLAAAVGAPPPEAAVVSLVIGDAARAAAIAAECLAHGVAVGCFRPPSVPAGTSRIRMTARATLSDEELTRAADVVVEAAKRLA